MKYLKMLGLAAIAALGLMAFLGAGTASATVLCETTVSPCPAGWDVAAGTELDFSIEPGTSAVLTDPFGGTIDTCTTGTVKGTTTNTGSATTTVSGHNSVLTFGTVATPCSRTVTVVTAGSLEVHSVAGTDNGTVTSIGATVILHNVPLFGSCQYSTGTGTDLGTLTGTGTTGGAPTFDIGADGTASISSENGCPKGTWEGSYVYTGSTNFNVAAS
jgi:hypothetical protein